MKHLRILALAATEMIASATWASAQEAYTTGDVNMRAGPGSRYPVVTTIPEDAGVYIHGCLSDWDWCDVSWRRNRGWVFSDYLEALYRNRRSGNNNTWNNDNDGGDTRMRSGTVDRNTTYNDNNDDVDNNQLTRRNRRVNPEDAPPSDRGLRCGTDDPNPDCPPNAARGRYSQ